MTTFLQWLIAAFLMVHPLEGHYLLHFIGDGMKALLHLSLVTSCEEVDKHLMSGSSMLCITKNGAFWSRRVSPEPSQLNKK
jgi:hypothetical protein